MRRRRRPLRRPRRFLRRRAAETTGGFDGARAYKHVEQLVAIGPHSAGSEGFTARRHTSSASSKVSGVRWRSRIFTPRHAGGRRGHEKHRGENSVRESEHHSCTHRTTTPSASPILSAPTTAGRARASCWSWRACFARERTAETIWLAFFDGEEAFNFNWADPDNTYGSRELARELALSGELPRVKAMILVDMVGPTNPLYKREIEFHSMAHRYHVVHGGAPGIRKRICQ